MKGFTPQERERIEHGLVAAGQELFAAYGLERTRIADLTDEVGIGTSTFYQFFDSKEALYLEIVEREIVGLGVRIEQEIAVQPTVEAEVERALRMLFDELETNEIFYRLLMEDEWQMLERRLPQVSIETHHREIISTFEGAAQRWTEHDGFRTDDPEAVINLFRFIAPVVRDKESLDRLGGEGTYARTKEVFITVITAGLFEGK